MTGKDRTVSKTSDGGWANKRDGASRPASIHPTQAAAVSQAREQLKNAGGGELKIKGEDGKIRAKDTIAPAKDPYPPKG